MATRRKKTTSRKTPQRKPSAPRARKEPTDIEKANAAGVQYAQDQINGEYFMNWVHDQLVEASRMPEDKVLPLETKSDAMVIAKKMLRQLERDTKRDNPDLEVLGRDASREDTAAFYDGFSATLELARDWLADELLEIKSEMGGRGRLSEERSNIPSQNPLSGPRKEERDLAIERAVKLARSTGEDHAVTMDRRGDYRVVVAHQAPAKDAIAFVNHRGHITHKRHGVGTSPEWRARIVQERRPTPRSRESWCVSSATDGSRKSTTAKAISVPVSLLRVAWTTSNANPRSGFQVFRSNTKSLRLRRQVRQDAQKPMGRRGSADRPASRG